MVILRRRTPRIQYALLCGRYRHPHPQIAESRNGIVIAVSRCSHQENP